MPLLGVLLKGLFVALAAFIGKFVAAQLAVRVAAVSSLFVFAAALVALFNATVAPLVASAFSTSFGQVMGLAFPPVAGTCLAAYALVWGACGLFALQRRATSIIAG